MNKPSQNTTSGPLSGVRVLDLSRILAGPTCTQLLADYGADVIKVEHPKGGDDTRKWGPPFVKNKDGNDSENSAYYLCANRNKRSITLDIASQEGADIVRELVRDADIFIENFKLGGLKKYGLGYDDIRAINPKVVYCSITGFGQTGPNAHLSGYDLMAQGYGGIMSLTGDAEGEPMKVGVGIADVMCGMYATTAILAALRHAEQTKEGQHIDIALVDSQMAWLINEGTNYMTSGDEPERRGNGHPNIVPYQVFEASDGHIIIAAGNDGQFGRLCRFLGVEELASDVRFATNEQRLLNRGTLISVLASELKKRSRQDIWDGLEKAGVPVGPVNSVAEALSSDQAQARNMTVSVDDAKAGKGHVDLIGNPVNFSKTPVSYRRPPPYLGEHTEEILEELEQRRSKE
jgi:crotonobetainyl-CoA:carnitine CoA-transferase CaiB-like acyl-CoA transferase